MVVFCYCSITYGICLDLEWRNFFERKKEQNYFRILSLSAIIYWNIVLSFVGIRHNDGYILFIWFPLSAYQISYMHCSTVNNLSYFAMFFLLVLSFFSFMFAIIHWDIWNMNTPQQRHFTCSNCKDVLSTATPQSIERKDETQLWNVDWNEHWISTSEKKKQVGKYKNVNKIQCKIKFGKLAFKKPSQN